MSISNVTGVFHVPQGQAQSGPQARQQALRALRHSLNTDDLAGARQAFALLTQGFGGVMQAQQGSAASVQSGNGLPLQNDIAALGRSLRAGNLAGAKHNLTAVLQDLQGQRQASLQGRTAAPGGGDGSVFASRLNLTA